MTSLATLGPEHSPSWLAARRYAPEAELQLYPLISEVIKAFTERRADRAIIPVYNTREGEIKEYFRVLEKLGRTYWVDNIVLPINLSLGVMDEHTEPAMLIGRGSALRQCEEFLADNFPGRPQLMITDINQAIDDARREERFDRGFIDSEEVLLARGLSIRQREVAPHNQTRFAVLGPEPAAPTGYDATALFSVPLRDRVGLLVDILAEFTRRGINIQDLRTEADIKSQKLRIFVEAEGHIRDASLQQAIRNIEENVVQEQGAIKVLGSFPRVDMRTKLINSFGFIGTGAMSRWFSDRLSREGYQTILTGRDSAVRPEEMIRQVDVVVICVPISATVATVEQYASLLRDGQALVLLAGEAENTLNTALDATGPGVELMLVHNLWGPQASTMKDKNAIVVRTSRSGPLCGEFEAFLYKHGADIYQDTPGRHDLLMGVGQKLPTLISVAMAMALQDNRIANRDIDSHATLTSLYGILAMARIHTQNARTYAEIMATSGDSRKIVRSFADNLLQLVELAENGRIEELVRIIERNRKYLTDDFLEARMNQSLAVDETLGRLIRA